jgi:hypothetical protein
MRAETGPMEFDNDWRGVFIRGDNAMNYIMHLESVLLKQENTNGLERMVLQELLSVLKESNHFSSDENLQRMKPFGECVQ